MTSFQNRKLIMALGVSATLACCGLATQSASAQGAVYQLNLFDGLQGGGGGGVDVTFEQRWKEPTIWTLISGTDDGGDGIPNGLDSIIVDRTPLATNAMRLSNESMPNHEIAKITGTGTGFGWNSGGRRDIILKQGANVTIGDMELLDAGLGAFTIFEERDQPLTINGVISGAGSLELVRNSGFSNGLQRPDEVTGEDEIILITGTAPNTLTGNVYLYNSNGSTTSPQPAYFVADKVGAFGQAALLELVSKNVNGLQAELQLTANTMGGEGAIDDDATSVFLGLNAVLNVDAGVNEVIGSGLLSIDLFNTGTPTIVPDGVYDNTADWIIGAGTITVGAGAPSLPGDTDGDGDIDDSDIGTSFANYTGPVGAAGGKTAADGDTDGDGDVDDSDIGTSFAGYTGSLGPASVPEPTSLALIGLGGLALIRRRRA